MDRHTNRRGVAIYSGEPVIIAPAASVTVTGQLRSTRSRGLRSEIARLLVRHAVRVAEYVTIVVVYAVRNGCRTERGSNFSGAGVIVVMDNLD